MVDAQNATIADGNTVHITSQIIEEFLAALHGGFAVDHPVFLPEGFRKTLFGTGNARQRHEFGPEDLRQGRDRNQILFSGGKPLPILRQAATGDQAMDMGMKNQLPGPGVQYSQDANVTADITHIGTQGLQRFGGGLEQGGVKRLLLPADNPPQFFRQGENNMVIGNRQQLCLTFVQPTLPVSGVAGRTTAIAAGMVGIVLMPAVITLRQVSTKHFRATGDNIIQRTLVTRRHSVTMQGAIVRAEGADDLCQIRHKGEPTRGLSSIH